MEITKKYLLEKKPYPMDLGILLNSVENPEASYNTIKEYVQENIPQSEQQDFLEEVIEYYNK